MVERYRRIAGVLGHIDWGIERSNVDNRHIGVIVQFRDGRPSITLWEHEKVFPSDTLLTQLMMVRG